MDFYKISYECQEPLDSSEYAKYDDLDDLASLKTISVQVQRLFEYPTFAKDKGITGKVYTEIDIDTLGRVHPVCIRKSAHPILDNYYLGNL